MKLKEVYPEKFLKSFGDRSEAVGDIAINTLAIDPLTVAHALNFTVKPISEKPAGNIPNNVIYTAHFYNPKMDNVFIAGQIAQQLWNRKPYDKIYVFDPSEEVLHRFVENLLMPDDLLASVIRLFIQDNGGMSGLANPNMSQLLLLEICNQFQVPMDVALNRLKELHLINVEGDLFR